jgi:hypothetical protein
LAGALSRGEGDHVVLIRRRVTDEERRRRRAWRSELRQFRWDLIKFEAVVVAAGVFVLLLPSQGHAVVIFELGALAATAVWLPFVVLVVRTYPETTGSSAEKRTRDLLGARSLGWTVVDDLPMERRDIDHVAVTPTAVLAVETKYWGPGGTRRSEQHQRDLEQALQGARSVRTLLRSVDIKQDAPVQPVLILWGGGVPEIEGGWRTERGVDVVVGQDGMTWARKYARGGLSAAQVRAITSTLVTYPGAPRLFRGMKIGNRRNVGTQANHLSAGLRRWR